MKRLLSCFSSDFKHLDRFQLKESIAASEGRVVVAETIGATPPLLGDVTNAEFAAAMGADLLILNLFDVDKPEILGLPKDSDRSVIEHVKYLTGRPVGINLEPTNPAADADDNLFRMTKGRTATVENAKAAVAQGIDFLVLTGNPGTGVGNEAIEKATSQIRSAVGDQILIIAGKMHGSGILEEAGEAIITEADVTGFIDAGADVVLLPAPGTIPGIGEAHLRKLIALIHKKGALAMTAIGTSQEGADTQTIRSIALMSKACGSDLHHIGDSGYLGMALPENIMAYSVALRGIRHTYHRMAASIRR